MKSVALGCGSVAEHLPSRHDASPGPGEKKTKQKQNSMKCKTKKKFKQIKFQEISPMNL
jgi:hypothetical protein